MLNMLNHIAENLGFFFLKKKITFDIFSQKELAPRYTGGIQW